MKSVPEHQRDCFETPAGWMTLEVFGGTLLGLQFQRSLDSKFRRMSSYRATILAWFQGGGRTGMATRLDVGESL